MKRLRCKYCGIKCDTTRGLNWHISMMHKDAKSRGMTGIRRLDVDRIVARYRVDENGFIAIKDLKASVTNE